MKKLLFVTGLVLAAQCTQAQPLQNQHKCIEWTRTWSHCADSYSQWCLGVFDTLSRIQNTPDFPCYFVTYDWAATYGQTDLVWAPGSTLETNCSPDWANQPNFAVNTKGLGITEIGYEMFGYYTGAPIYVDVVDTISTYVQRAVSGPAEASVGFTKTMITPDSVLIHTNTRFNINDSGMFTVAVYVIQDSARGWQATTIPGVDTLPHRNMIMASMQYNTWPWGMSIGNDTMMLAGSEYPVDFTMKIPATWNIAKLSYLVLVYKSSSVLGRHSVLNVTDGNFDIATEGINKPANKDLTSSMTVFPVPAKNYVNVEMQTAEPLTNCTINLYDITGRKAAQLYSGTVNPASRLTLQLPKDLSAGNYMLQLQNENISAVKQVTVQ